MWAVSLGGAGKVSILAYTMPFWLLMLAWPILREPVRGLQWGAVIFALAGLISILGPWNMHGLQSSLLAVAAGFVWALSSIVVKIMRSRHDIDLLTLIAWQGLFGSHTADHRRALHGHEAGGVERHLHRRSAVQRRPGERPHLGAVALHPPQPVDRHRRSQQPGRSRRGRDGGLDTAGRAARSCSRRSGMGLIVIALAILTARELAASQRGFVDRSEAASTSSPQAVPAGGGGRPGRGGPTARLGGRSHCAAALPGDSPDHRPEDELVRRPEREPVEMAGESDRVPHRGLDDAGATRPATGQHSNWSQPRPGPRISAARSSLRSGSNSSTRQKSRVSPGMTQTGSRRPRCAPTPPLSLIEAGRGASTTRSMRTTPSAPPMHRMAANTWAGGQSSSRVRCST